MKVEFNSLHWNNVDKDMLAAHQRVMDYFKIPMNYDNRDGHNHGMWMQWVIHRVMLLCLWNLIVFLLIRAT